MRYLTSISLALVVLMALACTAEPAAPTAVPPPAYSDTEVIGAEKGFLNGPGPQFSSEHLRVEEHYV